ICVDLQSLGVPLVAERSGTVGLGLLSLNVVGGIECGVTVGEGFDATRLLKARPEEGSAFSSSGRVYFSVIDTFVSRKEGRALFARRATKGALGCRDATCCRHGPDDMVRDPRRHGLIQRIREVDAIGSTPAHRRREAYLEHLINAGTLALRLA